MFDSIDFELTTTAEYDETTEKFIQKYSTCPWEWTVLGSTLYYAPNEESNVYWNFSFSIQLTAIPACTVTSFKINNVDVMSRITDQTQTDYYKTLSFSIPITSLLTDDVDLSSIPITFDISFSQGSETARLYNTESSATPMYLKLDGESHKLSYTKFTLVESYNNGGSFTLHQIPAAEYSNTASNEFITFPTKKVKDFKFLYSDSTKLKFSFNSIDVLSTNKVGKRLSILAAHSAKRCTIVSIDSTTVTCELDLTDLSGVQNLLQANYLRYYGDQMQVTYISPLNVTPVDGDQILEHKTGQIEAVDFIETEDNQILLQKGGRVWCKEFKEWNIATLPTKNEVYRFHDEDLTYNGSVVYDLQSFFGNIPTGTQISNTWTLPSGLVSFKNNCILNWYSKTDETTYNGYSIQLVLFNVDTTHRTYIDLSTATDFDNIIPDITATETEYATHAYLQLINNNTGITEDQVNSFNNVLEIYYQEGSHVDINDINYNKNYSITCKELKEV